MQGYMQNNRPVRTGKQGVLCNDCPCGCPSFVGRAVAYVDKNVIGGTGDGSSWANAYDNIQDAIDAHPKKEIQIQGYGEFDAYPTSVTLTECVYLKGIDDMWIGNSISGSVSQNTKLENLNITGQVSSCSYSIFLNLYIAQRITNCPNTVISNCQIGWVVDGGINLSFDNCDIVAHVARCTYSTFLNCNITAGTTLGFKQNNNSSFINCDIVHASGYSNQIGYEFNNNSTLLNCTQSGGAFGFVRNDDCTFTTCSASNNEFCGFINNINANYIGCSDINNCLSGNASCDPITGSCDVV